MSPDRLSCDFFSLFQLERRFLQDQKTLDQRYRDLQREVHPDRFVTASDLEKRLSLQMATRVNEAWQTLKKPLSRAIYILHLQGLDVLTEKTPLPASFLMEQMSWHEALETAREADDHAGLTQLFSRLQEEIKSRYAELTLCLDTTNDKVAAAEGVRCLMFLEKLAIQMDDAIAGN